MTVKDMIKVWAAARLDVPFETIKNVDFQESDGGWLSDYTYDPSYIMAKVEFKHGPPRYIALYDAHIPDVLKEILEANE